jgi:hypothetical protein
MMTGAGVKQNSQMPLIEVRNEWSE